MSLIKLSSEILDIKGRFGGVYYARDKSGLHIRARPRFHAYPHTIAQSPGIGGYSGAAAFWLMALCAYAAILWAGFALMYYFRGKDGKEKRISGFNWYLHYALTFPETESFPMWNPPISPTQRPDYIGVYDGTWQYQHTQDLWPIWSPGGYYYTVGLYAGKLYYRTDDFGWYLFWNGAKWVLSKALGAEPPDTTYYWDGPGASGWYYNALHDKTTRIYLGHD